MTDKHHAWKKTRSRIAHKNPYFRVKEDDIVKPGGKKKKYYAIESKDSVYIVALTAKKEVVLVRLYRYPTAKISWEVPGGGSDGQEPSAAAKRELWEETGYKARKWKKAGSFQIWSGVAREMGHTFIARGLTQTGKDKARDEGIEEMKAFSFSDIRKMIRSSELDDSKTIAALAQAALALGIKI